MLSNAINTPWRAANHARRLLAYPYIRLCFAWHGLPWGRGWRIFGMPIIQRHRQSTMQLGDYLELRSWVTTNPLAPYHPVVLSTRQAGAWFTIGHHCGLTGATIVAAEHVEIGNRVLLGANTVISDTDFHPLTPWERQQDILNGRHAPVIIEDDVFVGMNSLILKGVRLGQGCVVGAGSVVTNDVPPGVIVAGNPARRVGRTAAAPIPAESNGYAYPRRRGVL
ncbi:MAG: acyltransferase [Anaerolineae bacterium]|nr:acyltransferase [Anaerolineae bacterium]